MTQTGSDSHRKPEQPEEGRKERKKKRDMKIGVVSLGKNCVLSGRRVADVSLLLKPGGRSQTDIGSDFDLVRWSVNLEPFLQGTCPWGSLICPNVPLGAEASRSLNLSRVLGVGPRDAGSNPPGACPPRPLDLPPSMVWGLRFPGEPEPRGIRPW